MRKENPALTASMEDYLEMIFRLTVSNGFTRIHELSQALNVQPSSATKMVQRLAHMGYVKYEKYGFLMLEEKGKKSGEQLLNRHLLIEKFLRIIGVDTSAVLEETEKIEHMLNSETTDCIHRFVVFMLGNPDITERYASFRERPAKT